MRILILGGTRYFGIHLVNSLLERGYEISVATRGINPIPFSGKVKQEIIDRYNGHSLERLSNNEWDVVYDNLAYASNDVKIVLEKIRCKKYIMTSSAAVYTESTFNIGENKFNPLEKELIWCSRGDFPYDETKRQAECALFQIFKTQKSLAVRFPYVIGTDDYTKRLKFYVDHVVNEMPMHVDNLNQQLSFISSIDSGKFLAHLSSSSECGAINGSSIGTISVNEILEYTESITGKHVIINENGENAPYNGDLGNSLSVAKATETGFEFSELKAWVYSLIEHYVNQP